MQFALLEHVGCFAALQNWPDHHERNEALWRIAHSALCKWTWDGLVKWVETMSRGQCYLMVQLQAPAVRCRLKEIVFSGMVLRFRPILKAGFVKCGALGLATRPEHSQTENT